MKRKRLSNLECRVVELAVAKLLQSIADFPFVDSFVALEELVELVPNARLLATFPEEPRVQRFFQVFLRTLRHALRAPELKLVHRHLAPNGFQSPKLGLLLDLLKVSKP